MPAYKLLVEFDSLPELKSYIGDLSDRELPTGQPAALSTSGYIVPEKNKVPVPQKVTQEEVDNDPDAPAVLKSSGKRGRPAKSKDASAPAAEPAPEPETAAAPALEIPYSEVQKATLELVSKHGKEATVAVLKEFAVEKATFLKPEQFADYLKRVALKDKELTEASLA